MINNFGKGTILKGSDCELTITISTCCHRVDIDNMQNFSCAFYTEKGGQAVLKYKDDFKFEGKYGTVHFQDQELDQLPDGVIRYTLQYDNTTIELNTNYYLKTPIGYTPMDFVSRGEVDDAIASALTSSTGAEVINTVAQGLGFANEEFVNSAITQAVSGLASEKYVDQIVEGLATSEDIQGLQKQIDGLPASSAMTEAIQNTITASNLVYAKSNINKIWGGTRAAYSAQTIDNNTLYFIID